MADKSCQPNAEQEKSCHTTEHFPQHGVVDELCVDHTGADESRQKKNDRFHHAPKTTVETIVLSLMDRRSISFLPSLPIISVVFRQMASPSCSSTRLESSPTVTLLAL